MSGDVFWVFFLMKKEQIELELTYVKITDGVHVMKLLRLQRFEWDGGLLSQRRARNRMI